MKITLSVATSSDHYIDDTTPVRLTLSTPSDWAEVYRLRAASDAILIGGETLRSDNPTLGLKGVAAENNPKEPVRVVVSGRGEIPLNSKIFHKGSSDVIIFSNIGREELASKAEIITIPIIDVAFIVTELEKRGLRSLFVEGGAQILNMFLNSTLTTSLRLAVNPTIKVSDENAPRFELPTWVESRRATQEKFEEMEVTTYILNEGNEATQIDKELMQRTIRYSLLSPPKDSCYRVGAVIVTTQGEIFEGYTLETAPTHHAEQAAMTKALSAGADLKGATIYASMEPCSQRSSEPMSCSELIIKHGFKRVVFALYEPSHFVECHGAENLRRASIEVLYMPDFTDEVIDINRHVLE